MKLQAFLAALMITSTLVHELGHVAAGWCFGYRVVGVRWLPPGVHLRGPRGSGAVAPRVECLAVALGGPLMCFGWEGERNAGRGALVGWNACNRLSERLLWTLGVGSSDTGE